MVTWQVRGQLAKGQRVPGTNLIILEYMIFFPEKLSTSPSGVFVNLGFKHDLGNEFHFHVGGGLDKIRNFLWSIQRTSSFLGVCWIKKKKKKKSGNSL